ncbi:MAG: O-antigen ligase family protein [Bacillota bacterium]
MATVMMDAVLTPLPELVRQKRQLRAANTAGSRWVMAILVIWGAGLVIGLRASVAMLTVLGFAAAIAGLRRPRLGLIAAGVLCTLDPLMSSLIFTGGLLRWNTVNYLLLLVALLWLPLFWRRRDGSLRLIEACAVLLALELIISPDWRQGTQDLAGLCAVFGLVVYLGRRRFSRADWYWLGVVCGTLAAAGGVVFFLQRASLPVINANAWAFFPLTGLFAVCIALPCSLDRRRGPLVLTSLAGVLMVWVFLSGSRGSMLVASVCGVYVVLAAHGIGRRATLLAIAALTLLATTTQFTDLQRQSLERVRILFDSQAKLVDRTSHRSELLLGGWYIFLDNPLGVGTGGFTAVWRDMDRRDGIPAADRYRDKAVHAGWVKMLAENGLPGFALLAAFVMSFAVRGLRRPYRSMQALGLLTTAVLALELISTEYQSKGLWFMAAATMAMLGAGSPLRRRRRA